MRGSVSPRAKQSCGMLPVNLSAPSSSGLSGSAKKKARNALPQPFLVADGDQIIGAILICRLCEVDSLFYAVLGGVVLLVSPISVTHSDFVLRGVVDRLKPDAERRVRLSPAINGLSLNANLAAFATHVWRVIHLPTSEVAALRSPSQYFVEISPKHKAAMGLEAELLGSIFEALPSGVGVLDADPEQALSQPPQSSSAATQSFESSAIVIATRDAERALEHVRTVAVPRGGGIVTHTFPPERMLQALQLSSVLKPGTSLQSALALAAPFFFEVSASRRVASELLESTVDLPKEARLRDARLRLDLLDTLYEQTNMLDCECWRYLNPDSSPQLGWSWLVVREESFMFPRSEFGSLGSVADADLNAVHASRTCRLSTIGRGRGGLVNKAFKLSNIYKMESGAVEKYDQRRSQVIGLCADQGTERGCADIDVLRVRYDANGRPLWDERHSRMYPSCLYVPEHLHIVFNALQHAVEVLPVHRHFITRLKALEQFLADKQLRRFYVVTCLQGHASAAMFKQYSTVHIDWRWGVLNKALDQLIPLFNVMKGTFNIQNITMSDGGACDAALLKSVRETVGSPFFLVFAEMVRVQGATLERFAHRLEGCECNRHIWVRHRSATARTRALKTVSGWEKCCWRGKQAVWLQMEGLDTLCEDIAACSSDLLQSLLEDMPPKQKSELVRMQAQLAEALVEELRDKLRLHSQLPYSLLGMFYGELCHGDEAKAKARARAATDEYDSLVSKGLGDKIHRVAHVMCGQPTECRKQIDLWCRSSGEKLKQFPLAYCTVLKYCLVPVVGRRVEAAHAEIKRLGSVARNVTPPWISSALSEGRNLERLRTDPRFHVFCLEHLRSSKLLGDILALVATKAELAEMTRASKIHMVYQCSLDSEYKPLEEQQRAHTLYVENTMHVRGGAAMKMHPAWKACVDYLKAKLATGFVYSMPLELFDAISTEECWANLPLMSASDPWQEVCSWDGSAPHVFNMVDAPSTVFFETTNPYPERRFHVPMHHETLWNDAVYVSQRIMISSDVPSGRVVLLTARGSGATIHLLPLVEKMVATLRSLHRWSRVALTVGQAARKPLEKLPFPHAPLLPQSASDVVAVMRPASGCLSEFSGGAVSRQLVDDTEAAARLAAVRNLSDTLGGKAAPVQDLAVRYETVERLIHDGVLLASHDKDGAIEVSASPSNVRCVSVQAVGPGELLYNYEAYTQGVKLDMVLHLLRSGWKAVARAPTPFKPTGKACFLNELRKPASYFLCLASHQVLFSAGVPSIPHDWKDIQHQCLLRLRGVQLQEFFVEASG